jgi:hypothetical protein
MVKANLYRNWWRRAMAAGLALVVVQMLLAQAPRAQKPEKGPRALALVELGPNGKARLIPVAIMYNGEFYDASAYKADPVPMALDSGTIYEAERSGASQGLFTVSAALEGPNHAWMAQGTWLPAGAKPANAGHKAENKPRDLEPEDAPPVLRHSEKPKPTPESTTPPASSPAPSSPPPAPSSAPSQPAANAPAAPPAPAAAPPSPEITEEQDANRPTLKRGKPAPPREEPMTSPQAAAKKGPAAPKAAATASKSQVQASKVQTLPAISDAAGPDPHPYTYEMKPDEEQALRKKMLAMAAEEVQARARKLAAEIVSDEPASRPSRTAARSKAASKPAQPVFEQVEFRAFDLSTNNEPVLVLMADAHFAAAREGSAELEYMITLVARQDIYGDLHKAFSSVTDNQHLDVLPRYELIDAVDADGDGRGELLFRKTSDQGSAYVVYRVIGQQVWPLFEGTIGS